MHLKEQRRDGHAEPGLRSVVVNLKGDQSAGLRFNPGTFNHPGADTQKQTWDLT